MTFVMQYRLAPPNSMTSEVSVFPVKPDQRFRLSEFYPAPRLAPRCGSAEGEGRTGTCQMSSAYSRMVRSEENHAMRATLRMLARVQAGITCQRASTPRCAS